MLKALMLRKKIDDFKKALAEIRKKQAAFSTRESELETAIQEAVTDEEKATVETAVNEFEGEKADLESQAADLEEKIRDAEADLAEVEEKTQETKAEKPAEGRKDNFIMNTRGKFFGMTMEQRTAFFERDDVQSFVQRVRSLAKEERSVKGAELNIPTVVLDLIRENILETSKLLKHVNLKPVGGSSRQVVMGTVPEAVWTEATGKLNELDFSFSQAEVDGYKIAGYVAISNSTLEDSDIALAEAAIKGIGQAIGFSIDKAIVYGTGTKMMLGFVTRLAQTTEPAGYSVKERKWENLSTKNIVKFDSASMSGEQLFAKILEIASKAKGTYSLSGAKFWAMNRTTYATIMGKAVTAASTGAYVAQINNEMPIDRGAIEILDFIPDGDVVGGYGDLYLAVERAGTTFGTFDQTRAIEDETLFIGKARYDGKPIIAEGFVAFNINNKDVTTSVAFAPDKANTAETAG